MPTISVIVPVYKVEPYLHRCVDSILTQTFPDFELILVDDGSPDNCGAICDEFARKDSRVHVIHQKNGGLSAARNAGIDWAFANSDSQWLSFVDSDDWVHESYLEALLNAADQSGCAVSVCGYQETDGNNLQVSLTEAVAKIWNTETFYIQENINATVAWGKLYRKTCFEEIRYPVGKIHEDEFVTYRILFSCKQIPVIEEPLYYYFANQMGIMKSPWSPNRLAALEANKEQMAFFMDNCYINAYKYVIHRYIWNICDAYNLASQESCHVDNKHRIRKGLRKELRKAIQKYRCECDISIARYYRAYETAYPHLLQLYCYGSAVKQYFIKIVHRE